MVTLIFEQADRLELEAALQEQAELRQESQKMEALGRLAAAVAHDFNNVLSAVALGTRVFANGSPPDQLRETARELADMVGIGQRLCRQLLDFGRQRSQPVLGVVQLHELVERLLPVVRAGLGHGVALALHSSASDPRVRGDASQLEQVVLNLALNARDAVEGDGRIDIELRDATPADEVSPECVVLEVRDNGTGMDEATRSRVFEPFFTTKGQSSGLGLATVYGVVKRCGGVIRATSAPAAGTVMFVALPRALIS
jgi:signal transduction histidine kinase